MPFSKCEPDLVIEHRGVEVFNIYDDYGMAGPSDYWFTTDPTTSDDFFGHGKRGQFDARRFAAPGRWSETPTVKQWEDFWKPRFACEQDAIEALIEAAIEDGRLPISETAERRSVPMGLR